MPQFVFHNGEGLYWTAAGGGGWVKLPEADVFEEPEGEFPNLPAALRDGDTDYEPDGGWTRLPEVWETFCRRTCDPKLAWMERILNMRGIETLRDGFAFHAPILKIRSSKFAAAWSFIDEVPPGHPFGDNVTVYDAPDDHPFFAERT